MKFQGNERRMIQVCILIENINPTPKCSHTTIFAYTLYTLKESMRSSTKNMNTQRKIGAIFHLM